MRNLSHGEQRQLEIVLGLASDPKILLLDEPAAGLSSGESTEMAEFLMKLDPKLAILLIEHDMDVVFDVARQISVLHFGEILETGTPKQIHDEPRCRKSIWGPTDPWPFSKSRTSTLITATPMSCRACRCNSSRARSSACSAATASARPRW